jgi:hypothetical protein
MSIAVFKQLPDEARPLLLPVASFLCFPVANESECLSNNLNTAVCSHAAILSIEKLPIVKRIDNYHVT